MKIFSAAQIRRHDLQTMKESGISSEGLMERAAAGCSAKIAGLFTGRHFLIFCGKGNNGGDGLAIARLLHEKRERVKVFILENGHSGSQDFESNLQRLIQHEIPAHPINGIGDLPEVNKSDIIIDALFGTGLNKPLSGLAAEIAKHLNETVCTKISIDIPSGLFCDSSSKGNPVIRADHTLSFTNKLAFMMAENEPYTGRIHFIDIGLSKNFEDEEPSDLILPEADDFRSMVKKRPAFAHKGTFGHGAVVAGSHGMMGAAILAASGFLRSGAGKLTCYVPGCGYDIMQTSVPEAMCVTSGDERLLPFTLKSKYDAIGIGPGIGAGAATADLLSPILQSGSPLVLDADALNGIANNKNLLEALPVRTILTPHPGEFDRMFGKTENDFDRLALASESAKRYGVYIVLKGHHTATCSPEGKIFFNQTGNAGMAKPGMGDVLTGIITGLLAQSYPEEEACLLGVHIHGRAGDLSAIEHTQQAMTAMHVVESLEQVWKELI